MEEKDKPRSQRWEGSLLQGKDWFQEGTLKTKAKQECFSSASFALGVEGKKQRWMMPANVHSGWPRLPLGRAVSLGRWDYS